MATVTGDVARDYSAEANINPWVDADFTARNSMTPIISGFALKSNFNSAGFYSYTAAAPDQDDFEVKGETLNAAATFGDQVGCGGIDSSGNGYILWVNGNQWRIYKCDAFALTQLGGTENIAHSALDRISMRYQHASGTVTATARLNGVDTALVRADSTSIHTGDLEPTWYFNFDNNNSGGFRSIAIDGIAVGPQIVSINDSGPIVAGDDITAVTSTLVATGMTVGGLAVDDFTLLDDDNYTALMPWFTDGGEYPAFGTVTVVMTDGVNSPELSKTLALPDTWTSIQVESLSDDEDSLSGHPDSPLTIEIGGAIVYPNESVTFYSDTTFSDAPTGSVTAWYRSPENIMTRIIIINGEIASVGGITMRGLTARQLTMRSLTMRSL